MEDKGDCTHYIDDVSSNRIKDNFFLTGRMKDIQVKVAEVGELGGWNLRYVCFISSIFSVKYQLEVREKSGC